MQAVVVKVTDDTALSLGASASSSLSPIHHPAIERLKAQRKRRATPPKLTLLSDLFTKNSFHTALSLCYSCGRVSYYQVLLSVHAVVGWPELG